MVFGAQGGAQPSKPAAVRAEFPSSTRRCLRRSAIQAACSYFRVSRIGVSTVVPAISAISRRVSGRSFPELLHGRKDLAGDRGARVSPKSATAPDAIAVSLNDGCWAQKNMQHANLAERMTTRWCFQNIS